MVGQDLRKDSPTSCLEQPDAVLEMPKDGCGTWNWLILGLQDHRGTLYLPKALQASSVD